MYLALECRPYNPMCYDLHGYKGHKCATAEPLLKDHHWPQKCGLSRQVVSGDRFSYIEMYSRSFCQKCVVCQDRLFLMAVASHGGLQFLVLADR